MNKKQLEKAAKWLGRLEQKQGAYCMPVVVNRRGYAEFIAFIYKWKRPNKLAVFYLMELGNDKPKEIKRIIRICQN